MSEQTKDEMKSGKPAVTPGRPETVVTTEKGDKTLNEDELGKISGGTKPHGDQY